MKLAVVGKGGSGKSTVSWLVTRRLAEKNCPVLAIDADYNMDLSSNLGYEESDQTSYLKNAEKDFYEYLGLTEQDMYVDLPSKDTLKPFSFSEKDVFTAKYSHEVERNVDLMIFGGAHEDLYFGHRCSHAYISSLKYYLPLLELSPNTCVIVDSVAGTDMVNYGLYLGVDAILCVVEPTRNSQKVARQIYDVAKILNIPVFFVGNKGDSEDFETVVSIPFDEGLARLQYGEVSSRSKEVVDELLKHLEDQKFEFEAQWGRHKEWKRRYDEQLQRKKDESFSFIAMKGGL